MNWNKPARMFAVAGLALASAAAWGQVAIGTNTNGTVTVGTPNTNTGATTLGTTTVPVLSATNGGKGINPIGSTNGVLNALSPVGGPGGPSGAFAASGAAPGDPGTGMAYTAHDFTGAVTPVGLCTFCHTPHKAKSTLLLWNHTLSSNTFQWDVAATTSGTALPGFTGNAYNGPSAKCLSCHDGSVAIGDVGWFNEATHTGSGALWGTMRNSKTLVGTGGNLSGNHPVAIPYPFNGAPNVYNGSTTGAQLATNDFVGDPTANNIRLYSDVGGGAIVGKPTSGQTGIECSSCHDPHNKAAKENFFLRGKLVGSSTADGYLCLQCHQK